MSTKEQIAGNRTIDARFRAQQSAIEKKSDFVETKPFSTRPKSPVPPNNSLIFKPLRKSPKSSGAIRQKSLNPISTPPMCKTGVSHA
ncbi:MAG: hypothetical protein ABSB15_06425 [Bryobacteraceae bacterium]